MVVWSNPAKTDLQHIHDYIAEDSGFYAKKVVRDILQKSEVLDNFPNIGKVLPECRSQSIRELHIYSYRLIYEVEHDGVVVLALVHQRRSITSKDVTHTGE